MSDTAKCPFCGKYIDVTIKLEKCPKCDKFLSNIDLKNEVVKGHETAILYGFWAAIAFLIISMAVVGILGNWFGVIGNGKIIAVAVISGTVFVYYAVDNYFSTK